MYHVGHRVLKILHRYELPEKKNHTYSSFIWIRSSVWNNYFIRKSLKSFCNLVSLAYKFGKESISSYLKSVCQYTRDIYSVHTNPKIRKCGQVSDTILNSLTDMSLGEYGQCGQQDNVLISDATYFHWSGEICQQFLPSHPIWHLHHPGTTLSHCLSCTDVLT